MTEIIITPTSLYLLNYNERYRSSPRTHPERVSLLGHFFVGTVGTAIGRLGAIRQALRGGVLSVGARRIARSRGVHVMGTGLELVRLVHK